VKDFSYFERSNIIQNLENDHFDLIIIGGGITGAGIALDAASRGLKVALIEKSDFASGTSSKSTKLIHGGLRYLKQFHIKMVADVGRERRIVHKLAPHLVLPEKMLLPVLRKGSMGMLSISVGLKLYDFLAGVKGDDRRRMLGKKSTLSLEPLLPADKIKGSGLYAEYRTDDARLSIEIIKTALQYGAICINYVEAKEFIYHEEVISGVECIDNINNDKFTIKGRYIINAAGPWVDDVRAINQSRKGKQLFITKGVHLVVPKQKLPVRHSMYFEIHDGRMIFLIPRNQTTYIGTTDTPYDGDKNHPLVTKEDAVYLLKAVNDMFPDIDLRVTDIVSSWAGLRPLIYEEGKSASEISRKDEIFISSSGLISMAGGKLTGYRKMAKKVVNMIAKKLVKDGKTKFAKCKTLRIPLSGNNFQGSSQVKRYIKDITLMLKEQNVPGHYASYLVNNYGIQTDIIMELMKHYKDTDPELRLLKSELDFCLDYEMVCKLLDFIERRTGRLYFWIETVEKYKDEILQLFKLKFDWTEEQFQLEKEMILNAIKNSKEFD
jgi:glycerol-3-phosphate dehydrogenase